MAVDTVKRNKRNQKWTDENRDRINLIFKKGTKDLVEKASRQSGMSKSQWVEAAIYEKLARDQDG